MTEIVKTEFERYLDSLTVEDAINLSAVGMALECNDGRVVAIVQEGGCSNEKLHTSIRNALVDVVR